MAWFASRRVQMLLGGCVGAVVGAGVVELFDVPYLSVPVFIGFVAGQVVASLFVDKPAA